MPTQAIDTHEKQAPQLYQTIGRMAAVIGSDSYPTGDRAALKRMSEAAEPPLAFLRLMFELNNDDGWLGAKREWMTIAAGMALMAPSPHRPGRSAGGALAESKFSELRLERLLESDGQTRRVLILRSARFLAAKGESIDWNDFARLLLAREPEKQEAAKMRIAKEYYRHQKTEN